MRDRAGTLYQFYQETFGINVLTTEERVRRARAGVHESAWLSVPVDSPLLEVHRVAYLYRHTPVELRVSRVNTADYEYISPAGVGALP